MTAQAAPKNTASAGHRAWDFASIDWVAVLTDWAVAALIVLIGFWLAKWISRAIERALTRAHVETTLSGFLRNVSYAAMMVVVFIAALQKIGVPTTSVLAVVGAAGLAVGLALKDSLSNIAAGVMLIMLRPFRDGDSVLAAGLEGTVEEVRIFQTRMRTADNRLIILPNSMITTAPIINFTAKPQRRLDIAVTLRYQDDPARAKEILLAIATGDPLILKDPAPAVDIVRLSEAGMDMALYAWAKSKDVGVAKNRITEAVRSQLLGHGMCLPLPQRDLHVYHHNADGTPLSEIMTRSVADDPAALSGKPRT